MAIDVANFNKNFCNLIWFVFFLDEFNLAWRRIIVVGICLWIGTSFKQCPEIDELRNLWFVFSVDEWIRVFSIPWAEAVQAVELRNTILPESIDQPTDQARLAGAGLSVRGLWSGAGSSAAHFEQALVIMIKNPNLATYRDAQRVPM